jgi:hypothetical protein
MHVVKQVLLMVVFCFVVQSWLPWWTLVFPCVLISYVSSRSGTGSFLAGFLAVALLWLGMSLYIDWTTSSVLSQKVSMLFPGKSVTILRLITVIVGGLTGGFASLTGYFLKNIR